MKIVLLHGEGTFYQGWGNFETTKQVLKALKREGWTADVLQVSDIDSLERGLAISSPDLVWSSLYHLDQHKERVGRGREENWVADLLEKLQVPYIGHSAHIMRKISDKCSTNWFLKENGVDVPDQFVIPPGCKVPAISTTMIVKPRFESESNGISERSVVQTEEEAAERVRYIHAKFEQDALMETYLPGEEWTVSVFGHGANRQFYPAVNIISPQSYSKFPLIKSDMKFFDRKLTWLEKGTGLTYSAIDLAKAVAEAMDLVDHSRIDMRADAFGKMKTMEVNGIPGMDPGDSRSFSIFKLYHSCGDEFDCYRQFIRKIVVSAIKRNRLTHLLKEKV